MFTNKLTKARLEKLEKMKSKDLKPYGAIEVSKLSHSINSFKNSFEEDMSDIKFTLRGRVVLLRKMGKSGFLTFQEDGQRQQVFCSLSEMGDVYSVFKSMLDIGDIIEVTGYQYITRTGEKTLKAIDLKILTKSLEPLPEKFHGLEDEEVRARKRQIDLIVNKKSYETLKTRSRVISSLRMHMMDYDFLEVETPMLNEIPGGANAKPFITHHNALGIDRYLRIAPELYLKRLVVGGFNRVFEIGKNFRNEGIDSTHNPEFTSMEFYAAYSNYKALMTSIEIMIRDIVQENVSDYRNVSFGDKVINFNDWQQISYRDALIEIGDIPEDIIDEVELLSMYLREQGCKKANATLTLGKLWEIAFDEFVEGEIINPVFITDYPIDISPLARRKDDNPDIAERFELFIAGREIANGFNELNDPMDQYERFKAQVAEKESDDEAMFMDLEFIEALKTGLPPTAGAGIGIDRLVMLITDSQSIKDVIAFPAVRPLA